MDTATSVDTPSDERSSMTVPTDTSRDYFAEAVRIASGKSRLLAQPAHLKACVDVIMRLMAASEDVWVNTQPWPADWQKAFTISGQAGLRKAVPELQVFPYADPSGTAPGLQSPHNVVYR